jgi:hypothetical protein
VALVTLTVGRDDFGPRCHSEVAVKKLLLLVLVGVGAFAVWRKMESDKAEQDLWAQATDSV